MCWNQTLPFKGSEMYLPKGNGIPRSAEIVTAKSSCMYKKKCEKRRKQLKELKELLYSQYREHEDVPNLFEDANA